MNRKTIMILMLLAAAILFAGCQVTMTPTDPQAKEKAEAKKAEADTLERIRKMKIVQEETLLIRDILLLKAEVAKLQKEIVPPNQSKPARQTVEIPELGVEGEFIPQDELPENMK